VTIIFRDDVRALKVGSGSAIITAVEEHAVVRMVAHPKFDWLKHDYDAGIAKLKTPLVESAVQKPIA